MIAYSLLFGIISFSLSLSNTQQPFTGNMIWSIFVLMYPICQPVLAQLQL